MNKHFAYLTTHDEANFFQKVANEQAEEGMVAASQPMAKTAAAARVEGMTFEKVAARLEFDLGILKTGGEIGMGMGMQKRAGAYLDHIVETCEMSADQFGQLFDKVAGEAIMGDLTAAYDHLSVGLDDDACAWLDRELTKIGHELVQGAMLEKEAVVGAILGAGAKMLGRGLKAAVKAPVTIPMAAGRGITSATKAVAGKAGQGIRNARIRMGTSSLAKTKASLAKTEGKISDLAAKGKGSGIRSQFNQDVASSLRAKATKTQGKVDKLTNENLSKYSPKPAPAPTAPAGTSSPAATAASAPAKASEAASEAADKAGEAAKGGGAKGDPALAASTITPGSPGKGGGDLSMNASKGGDVTLKGSWEKMRDGGWKSLSSAEKQKLINAGAVAVVGGRVVTGKGVITGGDGII